MTPRTGTGWDALALVALLVPLAGAASPLAGVVERRRAVALGRGGALVAVALWVVVTALGAAPELGPYTPDPLATAAAAGAALLAAGVARPEVGPGALAAPPAAAVVALLCGVAAEPTSLDTAPGVALVVAAAVGALLALAVPSSRVPGLVVVLAGALVAGLRGAAALDDPPEALGVLLVAVAAVVAAGGTLARPRLGTRLVAATAPAALAVAALGVAAGPVAEARAGAALLAAASVLAAAGARPWSLAAALPGAAVVVAAVASPGAPGDPGAVARLAFAAALAAVVAALVLRRHEVPREPVDSPADAVAAALCAWLVLAPGSWSWALDDPRRLQPWDRAAAVALAASALAAVAAVALARRDGRPARAHR